MGYPKEIFLDQKDLSNIECPICYNVVKDGRTDRCGHTFCLECITESLAQHAVCPLNKFPLEKAELIKVFMFAELLKQKEVRCVNFASQCTWTGNLEFLDEHLKNTCELAPVPCPNKPCNASPRRKSLKEHLETCEFRTEPCNFCNAAIAIAKTQEHLGVCPEKLVPCPRECELEVKRKDLATHDSVCLNVEEACRRAPHGCPFKAKRRDLEKHYQAEYVAHEKLLIDAIGKLEGDIKVLRGNLAKADLGPKKNVPHQSAKPDSKIPPPKKPLPKDKNDKVDKK